MASDEENWKRRRDREREQDLEDEKEKEAALALSSSNVRKIKSAISEISSEKLDDLIQRADPMIDQVNNLYNMFASGAEKLAPIERRKQLDQVMLTLQMMSKPTQAALFKFSAIHSRYNTHRDRWDKMMMKLEKGKIKRTVGLKRVA